MPYIHRLSVGQPPPRIRRPARFERHEPAQAYVAHELTHFVGRHETTRHAQFELLKAIIRGGFLASRWQERAGGMEVVSGGGFTGISENASEPDAVCFCDIPVEHLDIHVSKYSSFGIAFDKEFVAMQGGAPVQYVPRNALVEGWTPSRRLGHEAKLHTALQTLDAGIHEQKEELHRLFETTSEELPLGEVFEDNARELEDLLNALDSYFHKKSKLIESASEEGATELKRRVSEIRWFLLQYFFNHLKSFDLGLPDDDPANYYMEREWRLVGKLNFEIQDIERVIVPPEYLDRLRADLPEYDGEITTGSTVG